MMAMGGGQGLGETNGAIREANGSLGMGMDVIFQ